MPTRILREGIISSERVMALSFGAQVLYYRLLSVLDDYGRFYAHPTNVRCACWPMDPSKVTDDDIRKWIEEITAGENPLATPYSVGGGRFIQVHNFDQRQRSRSKFPEQPASVARAVARELTASREQPAAGSDRARNTSTPTTPSSNKGGVGGKPDSEEFLAVWEIWPYKQSMDQAAQWWLSLVTVENKPQVLACFERFRASQQWADGAVGYLHRWLEAQSRDGWKGDWPAAKQRRNGHRRPTVADERTGEEASAHGGDTLPDGFETWTEDERAQWVKGGGK